jgi:hypothetical protein
MWRVLAFLLLGASPAWADVPEMGSDVTCADLARAMDRPEILPRCLTDEAAAKARLEEHWDEVPMDIAGGCAAAVLDSGSGSYQILAICIEDGLQAAALPSPFAPPEAP